MQLPLILGHSSSNEPFRVDLATLPHLFISFSEDADFTTLMSSLCHQLVTYEPGNKLRIAMAVNNHHAETMMDLVPAQYWFRKFITNKQEENLNTDSHLLFMRTMITTFKKRMRLAGEKRTAELGFTPLIFFSDNILDLVIVSRKRNVDVDFMQILLMGKQVGIHCIVASSASYRNLLSQLMHIHPNVKAVMEKNNIEIKVADNKTLGAELILSGEGLLFFKDKECNQYNKLYP
ncbi:MAG: hypothetical protein ABI402_07740 [Ferruginibacter sp.]